LQTNGYPIRIRAGGFIYIGHSRID
jgi:hypothetical protein